MLKGPDIGFPATKNLKKFLIQIIPDVLLKNKKKGGDFAAQTVNI